MSLPWKILLALAVVLPLGAFVVGSLASTANDEPPARQPIVIEDSPTTAVPPGRADRDEPSTRPRDDDGADGDDGDDGDDGGSGGVAVITPQPYEDDGPAGEDDADDGGPAGGGDHVDRDDDDDDRGDDDDGGDDHDDDGDDDDRGDD